MSTTSTANQLSRVTRTTDIRDILDILARDGAVIIEQFLTPDQVHRFNAELDTPLNSVDAGSRHDNPIFQEFHGANTKRMTNLVSRSQVFRTEVLDDDLFHALGDGTYRDQLGDWWLSTGQVIEIGPGSRPQFLHRDNENYTAFATLGNAAPEVCTNLIVALTEFTEENGATRVIPGSHLAADFADRGDPDDTIPVLMNSGDALYFSGKVTHGGGENRTDSELRRAVSIAIQASFLTPEEAHTLLIDRSLVAQLSPRVQQLIGFRSQYPLGSPGLWMADYEEIADQLAL